MEPQDTISLSLAYILFLQVALALCSHIAMLLRGVEAAGSSSSHTTPQEQPYLYTIMATGTSHHLMSSALQVTSAAVSITFTGGMQHPSKMWPSMYWTP